MLIKKCPWCENKISPYQLGSRAKKLKPRWYQFTTYTQVCPYCNNPVKLSSKGMYYLLLTLPAFLALPIQAIIGTTYFNTADYKLLIFAIASIGIGLFLLELTYEKDSE